MGAKKVVGAIKALQEAMLDAQSFRGLPGNTTPHPRCAGNR